jgi:hypothetical protein
MPRIMRDRKLSKKLSFERDCKIFTVKDAILLIEFSEFL